jgi:hypothetical protein
MELMALMMAMAEASSAAYAAGQEVQNLRQAVISRSSPTDYYEIDEALEVLESLSRLLQLHLWYLQSPGNLLSVPGTNAYHSGTPWLTGLMT